MSATGPKENSRELMSTWLLVGEGFQGDFFNRHGRNWILQHLIEALCRKGSQYVHKKVFGDYLLVGKNVIQLPRSLYCSWQS
jgi:hypothetical protein